MFHSPALGAALPVRPIAIAAAPRLHEIDGIRGWAALVVLACHLMWELFGEVVPEFRSPLLRFFLDGPLAVSVFFVLSGDALASPFLATGSRSFLDRAVLKRYFRLAIPIALSCTLVYVLMRNGALFHQAAAPIVHSPNWLGSFLAFEPNLGRMLSFSFAKVFTSFSQSSSYNPFLWPMAIELVGSFLVFAYLYVLPRLRRPVPTTVCVLLLAMLVDQYFSLFFAGVLIAQLRRNGLLAHWRRSSQAQWTSLGVVVSCVALDSLVAGPALTATQGGAALLGTAADRLGTLAGAVVLPADATSAAGRALDALLRARFNCVAAVALVFAIHCNRSLVGFFSSPLSRFLGRVSFPLYLTHFAVLASLSSWLIVQAHEAGGIGLTSALAICVISAAACLALATVFEPVERFLLSRIDHALRALLVRT